MDLKDLQRLLVLARTFERELAQQAFSSLDMSGYQFHRSNASLCESLIKAVSILHGEVEFPQRPMGMFEAANTGRPWPPEVPASGNAETIFEEQLVEGEPRYEGEGKPDPIPIVKGHKVKRRQTVTQRKTPPTTPATPGGDAA